jgi:hypothetical protein
MGVRYRNTFYSTSGIQYQIDIYDSLYSSSVNTFKTGDDVRLSYKNLTERVDPIFASELQVPFIMENSGHDWFFVNILRTSQEERFGVIVYRSGNIYWVGQLLNDLMQKEDIEFPYVLNLKFTDGLARLKDIDYNNNGTKYTDRDTILEHILKCISKTNITGYFGANDNFIRTMVNWYDVHHLIVPPNCPLAKTNLDHAVFYEYKEDGNTIEYKKTYDVLKYCLSQFNARILFAYGTYHIIQEREYSYNTAYNRIFDKTGNLKAWAFANPYQVAVTNSQRMAGGVYRYLPPLRRVVKKYKHKLTSNINNNLLPIQNDYETQVDLLNSLPGGGGELLYFNGMIHHWLTGTINAEFYVKFRLNFIITIAGSPKKYLTNKNGFYEWSTNIDDYVLYKTTLIQGAYWDYLFPIAFTTPVIPAECTATFQLYDIGLYKNNGLVYTLPSGSVWDYECLDFFLMLNIGNSITDNDEITYIALNKDNGGNLVASTLELELLDTIIGDGPLAFSLGRLKTYNGLTWINSSEWGFKNSTNRVNINQLAVDQCLKGQRYSIEKFSGTFINSNINGSSAIKWGSKIFVPLMLHQNLVLDEANGEWYNVLVDPLI